MAKKGYWVALVDVVDPEGYKLYVAANAKPFRKYGARFLTRGGAAEVPEGGMRSRVVVIEFPDHAAALACYRSPEYARGHGPQAGQGGSGSGHRRGLRRAAADGRVGTERQGPGPLRGTGM